EMAAVAGNASEFNVMFADQLVQALPKLGIGDRLQLPLITALPAVTLPASHPFRQTFADVFTVSEQLHPARAFESRETLDRRLQFHAIICRFALCPKRLFDLARGDVSQDVRPAPWPRIAAAGAVGEQQNFRFVFSGHNWDQMTNSVVFNENNVPIANYVIL